MPETTEQYHRVPTGKRKKKGEQIRTVTISKGIKALYDVKSKVIITYLFDKTKYTMKKAKEWVKKHKGSESHAEVAYLQSLAISEKEQLESYRQEAIAILKE